MATIAEASWQEILRQRLVERNNRDAAFAPIIEQFRKLGQQTKLLKERNASLLKAVGSVRSNPNSSTVFVPGVDDNPVRAAYVTSLEQQISTLRDELATVYKTQGQNAQRLLAMTETLREKEEQARLESENVRQLRDDIAVLRRKVDQHNELMSEKDRTAQILHDEISTLQLELGQVEERNGILQKDNAKLLQRWLDAKQTEANKMNEANDFYEDMRSRHQAVLSWRDGSNNRDGGGPLAGSSSDADASASADEAGGSGGGQGESGNGLVPDDANAAQTRDGTRSTSDPRTTLNPNG